MKTLDILTDRSKWTQGASARTRDGSSIRSTNPDACSWCILGALWKINEHYKTDDYEVKIASIIVDLYPEMVGSVIPTRIITEFNDHPDTTYEMVRKVLEHAGV